MKNPEKDSSEEKGPEKEEKQEPESNMEKIRRIEGMYDLIDEIAINRQSPDAAKDFIEKQVVDPDEKNMGWEHLVIQLVNNDKTDAAIRIAREIKDEKKREELESYIKKTLETK